MEKKTTLTLHSRLCDEEGVTGEDLVLYEILAFYGKSKYQPLPKEEIERWLGKADCDERLESLRQKSLILLSSDSEGNIMYKILKYDKPKKVVAPIFRGHLAELGVPQDLIDDFIKVRQAKNGVDTETAWKRMHEQIKDAEARFGVTAEECIKICVERSWRGFESEWIQKLGYKSKSSSSAAETCSDGTTMMLGKRYYRSARDGSMHECPADAPPRPSQYFDYSYSRMRWEAI